MRLFAFCMPLANKRTASSSFKQPDLSPNDCSTTLASSKAAPSSQDTKNSLIFPTVGQNAHPVRTRSYIYVQCPHLSKHVDPCFPQVRAQLKKLSSQDDAALITDLYGRISRGLSV
jgi:hypothetical protein